MCSYCDLWSSDKVQSIFCHRLILWNTWRSINPPQNDNVMPSSKHDNNYRCPPKMTWTTAIATCKSCLTSTFDLGSLRRTGAGMTWAQIWFALMPSSNSYDVSGHWAEIVSREMCRAQAIICGRPEKFARTARSNLHFLHPIQLHVAGCRDIVEGNFVLGWHSYRLGPHGAQL